MVQTNENKRILKITSYVKLINRQNIFGMDNALQILRHYSQAKHGGGIKR